MNKVTRTKIQKWTMKTLTDLFGPHREDWMPIWIIPFGATGGTVQITAILDQDPWLACKLSNPIHQQPDGFTYPRGDLDWPSQFTYPSGKHNLHCGSKTTFEEWQREVIAHLNDITAPGSAERARVGELI